MRLPQRLAPNDAPPRDGSPRHVREASLVNVLKSKSVDAGAEERLRPALPTLLCPSVVLC